MNKTMIVIISIIVIISAIVTAIVINKPEQSENSEVTETKVSEEKIIDECTEEYEELQNELLQANAEQEKISPNASLTLKIYYKKCGHTISQYVQVPENLVNMTREELQQEYENWSISKFSDTEIIIEKEQEGECGEHYIVRATDGKVTIYEILEDGTENKYEVTDISTEYLTDTDRLNMEKGVRVNGIQELNQYIEDFE